MHSKEEDKEEDEEEKFFSHNDQTLNV